MYDVTFSSLCSTVSEFLTMNPTDAADSTADRK